MVFLWIERLCPRIESSKWLWFHLWGTMTHICNDDANYLVSAPIGIHCTFILYFLPCLFSLKLCSEMVFLCMAVTFVTWRGVDLLQFGNLESCRCRGHQPLQRTSNQGQNHTMPFTQKKSCKKWIHTLKVSEIMAGLVRLVVAVVFLLTILGLGHSRRFRQVDYP